MHSVDLASLRSPTLSVLTDMARHFEGGASSFRAFVEKLEADAERGEADEAPIVEEGTEGIWVMTVHKALHCSHNLPARPKQSESRAENDG